jgi:hypothetical protein
LQSSEIIRKALVIPFVFPPPTWQRKREEVLRVLREQPGLSSPRVAELCGIGRFLVWRVRRELARDAAKAKRPARAG